MDAFSSSSECCENRGQPNEQPRAAPRLCDKGPGFPRPQSLQIHFISESRSFPVILIVLHLIHTVCLSWKCLLTNQFFKNLCTDYFIIPNIEILVINLREKLVNRSKREENNFT